MGMGINLLTAKIFLMSFKIHENGFWENQHIEGHCFDHHLCAAIADILTRKQCTSVIDMGCGPGWYVKELRKQQFDITGFDGNPNTPAITRKLLNDNSCCEVLDFTQPIRFDPKPDCILSLEVGEHIPAQFETTFIENLTQNASRMIILSWAIEDQTGDGHVNCRNNSYIIEAMKTHGFYEDIRSKNRLRLNAHLSWFTRSVMVFEKESITL